MKAKKLIALVLTLCLAFSCIAVVPFTAMVASAAGEQTASANKAAVWIGKSNNANYVQTPSCVFYPLRKASGLNDRDTGTFTCKVNMISGSKPYVTLFRPVSSTTETLEVHSDWVDNSTSTLDEYGNFSVKLHFNNIPGWGNTYVREYRPSGKVSRVNGQDAGDGEAVWDVIAIGNCTFNTDGTAAACDFNDEFIMSDPVLYADKDHSLHGGNYVKDFSENNDGAVYSIWRSGSSGTKTTAVNHPFVAPTYKWSKLTTNQDTVQFVTVDDGYVDYWEDENDPDFPSKYVHHAETENTREYYTCEDFGSNVYFQKFGTMCYSKIKSGDINKKAFVIKSRAGETKTSANIFIPMNTQKYFAAYDSTSGGITTNNNWFRARVTVKAKRLSGDGNLVFGNMFCNTYNDADNEYILGAPKPSMFGAYNPGQGTADSTENNGHSDEGDHAPWANVTFDAATNTYTADLAMEANCYNQMSQRGISNYLTIGTMEHTRKEGGSDANCYGSSFLISDIKMDVYSLRSSSSSTDADTLIWADVLPDMVAENCDADTQYAFKWNSNKMNGTVNVDMRRANLESYNVDGATQNVFVMNRSSCMTNPSHTLTHHAADATHREYWSCSCGKDYVDEYASKEADTLFATKKMIVIKGAGNRVRNAIMAFDNDGFIGTRYYIFRCKLKNFGDQLPTLSRAFADYYGGIRGVCENDTRDAAPDGSNVKWTFYDPATYTYTAVFTMYRSDPYDSSQHEDMSKYYNAHTGAHTAILLGNGKHVAGGLEDAKKTSTFAFTDPEVYQVDEANLAVANNAAAVAAIPTIGENLCPPITDVTTDWTSAYKYSNVSKLSSYYADGAANNVFNAKVNTWSREGNDSYIQLQNIPENFFGDFEATNAKMLRISGKGGNYHPVSGEFFIEPGATYQFDVDYRYSTAAARIKLEAATASGYSNLFVENLDTTLYGNTTLATGDQPGAHRAIRFTMPNDARVDGSGGNFRFYLGMSATNGITKATGAVYFANLTLKKVANATEANLKQTHTEGEGESAEEVVDFDNSKTYNSRITGNNIFMNGHLNLGQVGNISQANVNTQLFGWNLNTDSNGQAYITTFKNAKLMDIPTGFFTGDFGTNVTNRALKFAIGSDSWTEVQFRTELEPGKTYKLTYNYRGSDDTIDTEIQSAHSTAVITDDGIYQQNGKFTRSYTVTAPDAHWGDGDENFTFRFSFGDHGRDKDLIISNLQMHEVDGSGRIVGQNICGDLNPVYDEKAYTSDEMAVTLTSNKEDSMTRDFARGWIANYATTASVIKVSEHYFDYYPHADRVNYMISALLNTVNGYNPYTDVQNPYYNPDRDASTVTNILDLVKIKKDALNATDAGGAGVEANKLLTEIKTAANTATAASGKKTVYVDPSASSNGSGTQASPYNKLSSALTGRSSGDVILIKRGTTVRAQAGATYTVPGGVTIGAYGTGDKPIISGSVKNYAGASNWTNVGGNVWKTSISNPNNTSGATPGSVFFFTNSGDKVPALTSRILRKNSDNSDNAYFQSTSELSQEGDTYYKRDTHFSDDKSVYVYCTTNPGSKFARIEIGQKEPVITLNNSSKLDNLSVLYGGGHNIYAVTKSNITITNTESAYCGGTPNGTSPMGNGIQFGNGGNNLVVDHCYVHDCFDAGLTFQSYTKTTGTQYDFDGIEFTNNLCTNNFYNIEFFTIGDKTHKSTGDAGSANGAMKNIKIKGNILRFAGECFSYNQRPNDLLRCSNICVTENAWYVNTSNLVIEENIFDCTKVSMIFWTWDEAVITDACKDANGNPVADPSKHIGVTIRNNSYYQKAGAHDWRCNKFGHQVKTAFDFAASTSALRTSVSKMDESPAIVKWVNRADKF